MNKTSFSQLLKLAFALLVLLGLPHLTMAQFKKAKMIKTTMAVGYQKTPSQSFVDTTGNYGEEEVFLALKIPLVSRMLKGKKAGSFGLWAIMFNTGGSCVWADFTYLEGRRQLLRANAGLSGIYYGGRKSMYLGNINSFVAEDNSSISKPQLRINGSALMIHNVSKVFSYNIGAAYSFVFGSGLPVPILGCSFNIGKRSRLSLILPFNISYRYRFGKTNQFRVFLRPDGGLYNISNKNKFKEYNEIIELKQRVFQLGASCSVNLLPNIKLSPEAGLLNKRNIYLMEEGGSYKDAFIKVKTEPGYYLKVTLQIRFGSKAAYGGNDAVNYLIDNGIDNLPDGSTDKLNTD